MTERPSSAGAALLRSLESIETQIDALASRLEAVEGRLASLVLPAAEPLTVGEFARKYPTYTIGALRWLLFHRQQNGLSVAVLRRGRRVLIDERRFFEWEAGHRETVARSRGRRGGP